MFRLVRAGARVTSWILEPAESGGFRERAAQLLARWKTFRRVWAQSWITPLRGDRILAQELAKARTAFGLEDKQ